MIDRGRIAFDGSFERLRESSPTAAAC